MPVTVTRRSAPRGGVPARSVLALFYNVDFRLAFPFGLTTVSVKNILLAGYVAVQHFALAGCQVAMRSQVGLRGRFAWREGDPQTVLVN